MICHRVKSNHGYFCEYLETNVQEANRSVLLYPFYLIYRKQIPLGYVVQKVWSFVLLWTKKCNAWFGSWDKYRWITMRIKM
jgi:hypothetical protein